MECLVESTEVENLILYGKVFTRVLSGTTKNVYTACRHDLA